MNRRYLVIALTAGLAAPAFGKSPEPTLEQLFKNPPQQAEPRVRWWWPGADVTEEELAREIAMLDAAGFGGAEIQALSPNTTPPISPTDAARVNLYAEPRFFELVKAAGEAARAHGMDLDYTFGSSWPSGGGFAIPPEKALVELTMAVTEVVGGQVDPIKVAVPDRTSRLGALGAFDARTRDPAVADWKTRFDALGKTVSVIAMRGTAPRFAEGERASPLSVPIKLTALRDITEPGKLETDEVINLTDKLAEDGSLDWKAPPGRWQVFVFRQYGSNMGAMGAAGQGPQLVLDHFDESAFAAHAARVGDPLGKNPVGIRSTFVDSLELMQDLQWSKDFLPRFRELRGYDLEPYLPFIVQPGWMAAWLEHYSPPYFEADDRQLGERVREDYRQTVSDLLFERFLEPWKEWNRQHGLATKFQAHGGALDQIRAYGFADIPETEDLVDGGDPLFMRLARSGAHLYGRELVSAESLVWKDRPYDVTPDEMRERLDLLFAGGVNSVNLHGVPYRYADDNWPGWHAFQPSPFALGFSTMLTETNPVWDGVPQLAHYAARTQALLQAGDPVVPVALYYGDIGYYVGIETKGAHDRPIETGLLGAGYDYDRINPDALSSARLQGTRLVSSGGQAYDVLVLPPVDGIPVEVAEQIATFATAGLPVFFIDHAPTRATGLKDAASGDCRVSNALAVAVAAGARTVAQADIASALAVAKVPANLAFVGEAPSGIAFVQRRDGDRTVTFLYNGGKTDISPAVAFGGKGALSQWDAMSGTITPLATTIGDGRAVVSPAILAGQGALLVQNPDTAARKVAASRPLGQIVIPADAWKLAVDGHAAREPFAADLGKVGLGDWRENEALARFSGIGRYSAAADLSTAWLKPRRRVVLSLGDVHDMARVTVNGVELQPLVSRPWRLDVTSALKPGRNEFQIEVRNVLENAMIADSGPYQKLAPISAGLLGPVQLELSGTK